MGGGEGQRLIWLGNSLKLHACNLTLVLIESTKIACPGPVTITSK